MSLRSRLSRLFALSSVAFGVLAVFSIFVTLLPATAGAKSPVAAQANANPVITIGVAAPTSFFLAQTLGWPVVNAAQLALSQTNATGGLQMGGITYTLVLTYADDGCTPTQAITAANALVKARVSAVVGHVCSSASMSAQSVYAAAGVPMVSPASSSPDLTTYGYTTTFRTTSVDVSAARFVATYMRNVLKLSRSAIVDCYCQMMAPQYGDVYSATFVSLGGTITSRRIIHPGGTSTVLAEIKPENPEVILFVDSDPVSAGSFSSAAFYLAGMENVVIAWVPNYGGDTGLATYQNSAAGAVLDDVVGSMPYRTSDMPGWPAFLASYQAAHFADATNDPGVVGAFAYDAAKIIIGAIQRANNGAPRLVRNQIAATHGYNGVVGTYLGFDARGDVIPQWAWLWHYETSQWVAYAVRPVNVYTPIVYRQ